MNRLPIMAFLGTLLLSPAAFAACPSPFTVKDAAGATQSISSINDASNNCVFKSGLSDATGAAFGTSGNPVFVDGSVAPGGSVAGVRGSLAFSNIGGNKALPEICGSTAFVTPTTATNTQVVALSSGKNIYVCGLQYSSNGANNFYLESATAGACGGTLAQITNTWYTTQFSQLAHADPYYQGINTGASNALCINTTGATALSVLVFYDQY